MKALDFQSTAEIKVPEKIIDQIIGQESGAEIIKKAAEQRRNVVLIGTPGTGKSLLGQALAELLPKSKLTDTLALHNETDENTPIVKTVPAGQGKKLVEKAKLQNLAGMKNQQFLYFGLAFVSLMLPWYLRSTYGDIMAAASLIAGIMFTGVVMISFGMGMRRNNKTMEPKLIVDNSALNKAPFIDATGSHAGALLGDVAHDPLQSGGLGTPSNLRVQAGAIHKANGGVLFIDEIATLDSHSQQELLTTMQEKKYPITGQSEKSSGAMTRTEPVPCDFVLVAAGNLETV